MRVVYMGTPHASVPSLRAVAEAFEVPAVYTQPDRPRGRGRETLPSPVKEAALELGLRVVEP
ncbi:MAG TPA: methionyl-tRNA formyltransferase, partial [Actinomycetota bacterium]|nr:methionyl-tRNA formyltransferase [Actinomycetota bacterium]